MMTLFQSVIENEYRGRVMGLLGASANVVVPLAIVLSGFILEKSNPFVVLFGFGLFLLPLLLIGFRSKVTYILE
jgi:hypothetical protein